ncbi:recombination regulator RecX [Bordetella sp. FB-8]|uniref:recombination regulator RecX n=1 Tax=Bordetella sp. FB-8 TaxID=1159870 RepID=UPI0009DB6979|nr:recombination regulator RecX [Bordetella sp. FB-8]
MPPRNKPNPTARTVAGDTACDDGGFETLASPAQAPADQPTQAAPRRGLSLKARAVGYLSRREYARQELARKLRPYAEDPAEIESVLDALQREGWQSNERFARSLVHRRAPLRGTARIVQELRQHGLDDAVLAQASVQLKATEHERAQAVWAKRYTAKPIDRIDYARQARFLASRGFSQEAIHRVLGRGCEDA